MFLSVFDLFKVCIGPSSSHTMGPMVAARRFLELLRDGDWPRPASAVVDRLSVSLHGSLAFTGKGHATDLAVMYGLMGEIPATMNPDNAKGLVSELKGRRRISAEGFPEWRFDPENDLVFDYDETLPGHVNGMRFNAFDGAGNLLLRQTYYSVGGGFVLDELEIQHSKTSASADERAGIPYPFESAAEMLSLAQSSGLSIAQMKRANELVSLSQRELGQGIDDIATAMRDCVERGISQEGELPGGLHVKRRAKRISDRLEANWAQNDHGPLAANDWLSVYAIAVNEENAAGGRIVTAPTNGAAGVIPAVLSYYSRFHPGVTKTDVEDFFLTASSIGGIIKHKASISGAEVGCQGEVGSASAMAAAGLAAMMGATPKQVENAAEIALEHHLGMTCDPVGGLVQVPCIERNALGAVKAVTAASLALHGTGDHFVPLDACIETMRQTGADMHGNYKETSQGGLAVNVPVNMVEC